MEDASRAAPNVQPTRGDVAEGSTLDHRGRAGSDGEPQAKPPIGLEGVLARAFDRQVFEDRCGTKQVNGHTVRRIDREVVEACITTKHGDAVRGVEQGEVVDA